MYANLEWYSVVDVSEWFKILIPSCGEFQLDVYDGIILIYVDAYWEGGPCSIK